MKGILDNTELYFIPMINPEGYQHNVDNDPNGGGMQRKNLRPLSSGTIDPNRGVDLNRNFDYYFGLNNVGSSGTTTSGTYRGPSAESEPETQIMVDFIESRKTLAPTGLTYSNLESDLFPLQNLESRLGCLLDQAILSEGKYCLLYITRFL